MLHAIAALVSVAAAPDGARRCSPASIVLLTGAAAGFAFARFLLGLGEGGNFPAAIKTIAEWFPKKERALRHRHLQLRHQHRRAVTPLVVPWITLR